MIFLLFMLFSFSLMQAVTLTTKHVMDFEESAKTFSSEVATQIGKNLGVGIAEGIKEWGKTGEQTGSDVGAFQTSFLKSYNVKFLNEVAPKLSKLILSFSVLIGSGLLVTGVLAVTGQQVARIAWEYADRLLKKPKIFTRSVPARSWYQSIKKRLLGSTKPLEMILDDSVKSQLHTLIDITSAIYNGKIKSSYSNVLLYGAPGTGKTLFARYFAERAGMEYAETTGGAFLQEGAGIEAVNAIFDYAKKTKGLILFIDEADSLFVDRNELSVGHNARKYEILNHLLNLLGEPNNKLMLICATNHPVIFDEAMSRRFTQAIELPLPDQKARAELFLLYLAELGNNFKNGSNEKKVVEVICDDSRFLAFCINSSEGMSGSDIDTVIRLFGNDLVLHGIQKPNIVFDAHQTMQAKIAEYRQKMKLFSKAR